MHFDIRNIKHIKHQFDPKFMDIIKNAAIQGKSEKATIGKIINGKYTTSYDKWCTANFVDYANFNDQVNIIKSKCQDLIQENFKVKPELQEIHFLQYQNDCYYKSHIDGQYIDNNIAKRGVDRDITCVVYLNEDYEGGLITFDFFNLSVKPKKGDILIYPTTYQYTHGVSKVTGERYAIVFWFKTTPNINVDMPIHDKSVLKFLQSITE